MISFECAQKFKLRLFFITQFSVMLLFIVLYKVVLTFESVDKNLKCDHSIESYGAVLSYAAVYYVKGGSNF